MKIQLLLEQAKSQPVLSQCMEHAKKFSSGIRSSHSYNVKHSDIMLYSSTCYGLTVLIEYFIRLITHPVIALLE